MAKGRKMAATKKRKTAAKRKYQNSSVSISGNVGSGTQDNSTTDNSSRYSERTTTTTRGGGMRRRTPMPLPPGKQAGGKMKPKSPKRKKYQNSSVSISGNVGSGTQDNSTIDNSTRESYRSKTTMGSGSGKRSPFSRYQDGDGFGTSNMPSSADIARRNRSNRGGLKSPSKPKKTAPRRGKMQDGGYNYPKGAILGPTSKKEMRGIKKKQRELNKAIRSIQKRNKK